MNGGDDVLQTLGRTVRQLQTLEEATELSGNVLGAKEVRTNLQETQGSFDSCCLACSQTLQTLRETTGKSQGIVATVELVGGVHPQLAGSGALATVRAGGVNLRVQAANLCCIVLDETLHSSKSEVA